MPSNRNWRAALVVGLACVCMGQAPSHPQPRELRVNGTALPYIEQGSGSPVVFVHGAVGDYRYWEPQREDIARKFRFISYTQRYHGTGTWPDRGSEYSAATHAADLSALIQELNAGPVHLVGLSYGGTVAAMVAREHPRLVRTLTLAEPGLFGLLAEVPEGKPILEEVGKTFARLAETVKAGDFVGATRMLVAWVNNLSEADFDRLPPVLRRMLEENAHTLPLLLESPPVLDLTCASLGTIKTPTLVVRGQQTPRAFSATNERVLACVPGSHPAVVPKAAHTMSYENPAAFNAAVLQFFAEHE